MSQSNIRQLYFSAATYYNIGYGCITVTIKTMEDYGISSFTQSVDFIFAAFFRDCSYNILAIA